MTLYNVQRYDNKFNYNLFIFNIYIVKSTKIGEILQ